MHGDGTSAGTERIAPFTLGHPSADGLDVRSASLGELLKRLSADGGHLVQQEIQLAKAELVGAVILVGAGVMAKRAMAGFKAALAPRATLHTLQDDAAWAKRETTRVKQKLSA
jgi:hypothetical protein